MASLLLLPPEICATICGEVDRAALGVLCRISPLLRDQAQRMLYHTVDLQDRNMRLLRSWCLAGNPALASRRTRSCAFTTAPKQSRTLRRPENQPRPRAVRQPQGADRAPRARYPHGRLGPDVDTRGMHLPPDPLRQLLLQLHRRGALHRPTARPASTVSAVFLQLLMHRRAASESDRHRCPARRGGLAAGCETARAHPDPLPAVRVSPGPLSLGPLRLDSEDADAGPRGRGMGQLHSRHRRRHRTSLACAAPLRYQRERETAQFFFSIERVPDSRPAALHAHRDVRVPPPPRRMLLGTDGDDLQRWHAMRSWPLFGLAILEGCPTASPGDRRRGAIRGPRAEMHCHARRRERRRCL
ncbi:hypothetical protein B0H10DRAFT_1381067 [Mycena sp. CBHHK59/15]|nr:hypothetical protein B0H10DRAFT_1381067 [Mycena sp. CBHHK59/15]